MMMAVENAKVKLVDNKLKVAVVASKHIICSAIGDLVRAIISILPKEP